MLVASPTPRSFISTSRHRLSAASPVICERHKPRYVNQILADTVLCKSDTGCVLACNAAKAIRYSDLTAWVQPLCRASWCKNDTWCQCVWRHGDAVKLLMTSLSDTGWYFVRSASYCNYVRQALSDQGHGSVLDVRKRLYYPSIDSSRSKLANHILHWDNKLPPLKHSSFRNRSIWREYAVAAEALRWCWWWWRWW